MRTIFPTVTQKTNRFLRLVRSSVFICISSLSLKPFRLSRFFNEAFYFIFSPAQEVKQHETAKIYACSTVKRKRKDDDHLRDIANIKKQRISSALTNCTIFISITPSAALRRPLKFITLQTMRLRARTTIKRCSNG